MKNIKSLIKLVLGMFFLFNAINSNSQIPNSSFENWEYIQNYEKPTQWESNQDSIFSRIEKDTISTNGEYSMKLVSNNLNGWLGCESEVKTNFKLDNILGENKSLFFHVKSIPNNSSGTTYTKITVRLYEGESYSNVQWYNNEVFDSFTLIELPLTNPNADSLVIFINGGANLATNDICENISTTWIDEMEINESLVSSVSYKEKDILKLYPNPTNGIINLKGSILDEIKSFRIFNIVGQELEKGEIEELTIQIKHEGILILLFQTRSNKIIVRKIHSLKN